MPSIKSSRRRRIRYRIRNKVEGTSACPRLSVYRSNKGIYCQLIDDSQGQTLAHASTLDAAIINLKGNKSDKAKEVGKLIAQRGKENNIEKVVFDRGGYLYHGRVKALADGAREGGLAF